jgi:hypothetical protein
MYLSKITEIIRFSLTRSFIRSLRLSITLTNSYLPICVYRFLVYFGNDATACLSRFRLSRSSFLLVIYNIGRTLKLVHMMKQLPAILFG